MYFAVMSLYTTNLWLLIFLYGYTLATIIFFMLAYTKDDKQMDFHYIVFIMIFPVFVNFPMAYEPKSLSLRIFFIIFSFCGLIFFAYSFAQLQYTIMNPSAYRYKQIDNFHQLQNQNFILLSPFDTMEQLMVSV